ncbi:MAG: hypothetical protein EXS03_08740, partial [Phycisphaerales bacterium]|nr:hypothetical protein [Phycisphaerales bacterium]
MCAATLAAVVLPAAAQCPGDLMEDGIVGGSDLGALLGAWGTDSSEADLTADGVVDGADLGALLTYWGPCPVQWATVLEQIPDPVVVTDATLRAAIAATGLPWRDRDNASNIEMLLVPPGTFMMGKSPGDPEAWSDESPQHQVTLTSAFYMG